MIACEIFEAPTTVTTSNKTIFKVNTEHMPNFNIYIRNYSNITAYPTILYSPYADFTGSFFGTMTALNNSVDLTGSTFFAAPFLIVQMSATATINPSQIKMCITYFKKEI